MQSEEVRKSLVSLRRERREGEMIACEAGIPPEVKVKSSSVELGAGNNIGEKLYDRDMSKSRR